MKSNKNVFNPPATETRLGKQGELITPAEQQAAINAKKSESLKRKNKIKKIAGTAVSSVLALAGGVTAGKAVVDVLDRNDAPTRENVSPNSNDFDSESRPTKQPMDDVIIVDKVPEPITDYRGPKSPVTTMEPPVGVSGDEPNTGMIDRPSDNFDREVKEDDNTYTTTIPESYYDNKEEPKKIPTTTIEPPMTTIDNRPYATTIPEDIVRFEVPSVEVNEGMIEQPAQTSTTTTSVPVTIPRQP